MTVTTLTKGGNHKITGTYCQFSVRYDRPVTTDLIILSLDHTGKVRGDYDMVYYNQPVSPSQCTYLCEGGAVINFQMLDPQITKFVVALSVEGGDASHLGRLTTDVSTGHEGFELPAADLTNETMILLAEVYWHNGEWKIRNKSQGYAGGLAALVTAYGVQVDNAAAPVPVLSEVDKRREDWLRKPGDRASAVDIRKYQVSVSLEKKGVLGKLARVCVVLDYSGSILGLYRRGIMQAVLERLVPVASRLDDNGTLEVFAFATTATRLPSVTEADVGGYLDRRDVKQKLGRLGPDNVEPLVMQDLMHLYFIEEPSSDPVLVLFLSDGGVGVGPWGYRGDINEEIRIELVQSRMSAVFWQFMGLGHNSYGELERLERLRGPGINNASFFVADDIDRMTDDELYELLLTPYAAWRKQAESAGIVT